MFSSKRNKYALLAIFMVVVVGSASGYYYMNSLVISADQKPVVTESSQEKTEKVESKLLPAQNELLVKFKSTTDQAKKDKFYAKHGAKEKSEISQIGVKVITLDATDPEQKAKEIRVSDADSIEYIEPNFTYESSATPNDPYYASSQSSWFTVANAPAGWDITTGEGSIIAVADTGVNPAHPDLAAKLLPGYNFFDNNTDSADVYGHGTPVAGVSSAISNNTVGVAGSSWNSQIIPIRISAPTGSAYTSAMANAITFAADHGAAVVNLSFGGPSPSVALQSAVDYAKTKNVIVVASAGNYSSEVIQYPAGLTGVIGVSALELSTGFTSLTSYSTYNTAVDVSATGCLYSATMGGSYGSFCGTSNAAPVVTGLVALMKSVNPALTVQQVTDYLAQNSTDLGTVGWDKYFGWGRIDYGKTLAAVKSGVLPIPTNGTLTGKVKDATGIALAGATVKASLSSVEKASVVTGADGSYTFSLAPGSYSVAASAPNYSNTTNTAIVDSSSVKTLDLTMTILPAADTVAPTVSISSPVVGASVKLGTKQAINVTASDNSGKVAKVEFYIDGKLTNTDTASPFSYTWNVNRKLTVGAHTISAKAYDAANNSATSSININITK